MKITIRRPDDFHVHFRQGNMLQTVAPITARQFARALVMPNTTPPITRTREALDYDLAIREATLGFDFTTLLTIKLGASDNCYNAVCDSKNHTTRIIAGKLYPEGVTTNSQDGVKNTKDLYYILGMMEKLGMVLSIHGETPAAFVLDRERFFLDELSDIVTRFPKLKIVLEHITTSNAMRFVEEAPDAIAATITVHHLLITLHDLLCFKREGGMNF